MTWRQHVNAQMQELGDRKGQSSFLMKTHFLKLILDDSAPFAKGSKIQLGSKRQARALGNTDNFFVFQTFTLI